MKLFGWKSAGRASVRPAHRHVSLSRGSSWSMGEWPRSYEAQVRDGYLSNAVAQRAVRLIAEGVASARLKASDEGARALIATTSGGQCLMETLATQILLHGNGYVQIMTAPDGSPCELYALRPERVSVEADARGWPAAFRYKVGDTVTRFTSEELIHIRTHHPLDDHYGLGCLGAASGAIAIHNASARWNKALLDNAARPSGALVHEAAEALTEDQFERLKGELTAGFSGQANAGRPMLLEGGLKWQSLSLSPADMDFAGLKAAAAREIALAFGVPPVLLGLPGDATYSNYREANKALWRQAVLPMADKIIDALAQGLRPWFPELSLSLDLDAAPALAEERERLWVQLQGADFLALNEKRELAGFPAINLPEAAAEPAKDDRDKEEAPTEVKFNAWHDPDNGQFTYSGQGVRATGSASTSSTSQISRAPRKTGTAGSAASPTRTAATPTAKRPYQDQDFVPEIPGYPETGKNAWRRSNDQVFIDAANAFNRENKLSPDDERYQYATTLKAQAMVESGGDKEAFLRDPLQFNNQGDNADDKEQLTGIKPNQIMTPALSAKAALQWIDHKSFERPKGAPWNSPRLYRGKAIGLRRYNGNSKLSPDGVTEHRDWYVRKIQNLSIQANHEWREKNPLIPIAN